MGTLEDEPYDRKEWLAWSGLCLELSPELSSGHVYLAIHRKSVFLDKALLVPALMVGQALHMATE